MPDSKQGEKPLVAKAREKEDLPPFFSLLLSHTFLGVWLGGRRCDKRA